MKQTGGPPRSREGYHWFRGWRKPTAAQRRVLDELLAGGTNAQIAERLGISEDGVKWHLSELRDETGLPGRRELADWWAEERQRPGVNVLAPLAALWRLAAHNAAATAIVLGVSTAALLAGWFAYDGLRDGGDATASAPAPAAATSPAAAVPFVPTPTPTPAPGGALLFDVRTGEARVLPGDYTYRRWLDTQAMTFTVVDGLASQIDAEGNLMPILDRSGVQVLPDTDKGRVVVWDWDGGLLEVVDVATRQVVQTGDFGRMPGSRRNWAVSPAAGKVALSDDPFDSVTLYGFDAGDPSVIFTTGEEEIVWRVEWSRNGEWLLVVAGVRTATNSIEQERSLVFLADGSLVLERAGAAGWLGARALGFFPRLGAGSGELTSIMDMAHQGEIPIPEGTVLCISPDGRYAVTADPPMRFGTPTEHRLVDLVTQEQIVAATVNAFLIHCDWTPDGSMVVLSSGGK